MNQPPADAVRVPCERLQRFVHAAARKLGMTDDQAGLLARLLVANDLRGVFSHGSAALHRYASEIIAGRVNPSPNVRIVRETPNSLVIDGDAGLGYFPAYQGTLRTIDKALECGMAAMVTRNHGHIGAAGIYTRMTLQHDLLSFMTSGVQLKIPPGASVINAAGASPMSFSAPSHDEPPLVLDCGVTHDIQGGAPHVPELTSLAPGLVLRALGFGAICQAWGGLLAGIPVDNAKANRQFPGAHQGAMLFACRISLFADPDQFKREIDEYARSVRKLQPLPGTAGAYLPGGIEAEHETHYRRDGVPIGEQHRERLEAVAADLKLEVPWA